MRSSRINCSLATEFALVQENILIENERITQLYVIQSEQNPFLWFGVLFVDRGIYEGAVIRFSVYIDDTYPDCTCPKVVFDPVPFHPLVNPMTGELDTKNAFPDWNSNTRKLYELLLFVKRVIRQADEYITQIVDLLKESSSAHTKDGKIDPTGSIQSSSVGAGDVDKLDGHQMDASSRSQSNKVIATEESNLTANDSDPAYSGESFSQEVKNLFQWFHHSLAFVRVYESQPGEFERRIDEFKQRCCERLLDRPALCGNDMNAIVFTPWNADIHEPIRECVLAGRFTPSSMFATYHKETESVSFVPGHEPGSE